ncbi:MAG: type II secretion system protein [Nitrosomonadales bacterium]|nr:type II secretion system protein [Nitrosomonadales bacterium]
MTVQRARGFTLIEVAITAAIVALLATVAFPMAEVAVQRSKEQELRAALWQIREALDAYKQAGDDGHILRKAGESGYPPSLQVLVDGVEDAKSPEAAKPKIYFLRRIPRDPFHKESNKPTEQIWGKRRYASSATDPKEGKDVFDVYSLAAGAGLNGVPYREW